MSVCLEQKCREFWRRSFHSRAPSSSAADYVKHTGNADVTPLESEKVPLPKSGLTFCGKMQEVLPLNLME